jgi:PAS domain S-box-containing protein
MAYNKDSNTNEIDYQETSAERARRMMTGGVPQFMVFLNGMILTVVAYMVLSIFMSDIMVDEYRTMVDETRETVSEHVERVQDDLQMLSTILTLSGASTGEMAKQGIQKASPDTRLFDHLIWIYKDEAGSWKYRDLLDDMTPGSQHKPLTVNKGIALVQYIMGHRGKSVDEPFVLSDYSASDYTQENDSPIVKSRMLIIARNLHDGTNDRGILAAVTRMHVIVDMDWLVSQPMIRRLTIADGASNKRLFLMDRAMNDVEEVGSKGDFTYNFDMNIAGNSWRTEIRVGSDRNMMFLRQSPLLLLFFGLTLTIVGTMYVRSNQKQSYRLSSVNRALAQKNYELNSEMAERERLNQTLRKAEREYRAIIDSVSDIIFELNSDGDFLFLNETWPRITGYEIEQCIHRNLFDMLHPQDQEEQRAAFKQLVIGKRPAYRSFTRLRTNTGVYHAAELAMSMLRQDETKQLRVVGSITDVEERRRTERALTEAEKKYRTIVENAAGGIYQVTPEGHFLSVNPAYARILNYDSVDHVMKHVRNAHEQLYRLPRERARFIRELEQKGVVQGFESEMLTRNGDFIWVNENARTVRDDEGHILYYEGSLEDITPRKEAELKMSEAMLQSDLANRAKSEFLANMSHELRTPLNAIIGFSEIISNEVFGAINHRQYWEYAKDIHLSGKQLLRIINDILDVSRIDAGDRQLNESSINMEQVVTGCIDFLKGKIDEAGLTVNNATLKHVPNLVGEELAVKQSLLNILSNAIKFTQPGGSITISDEIDSDGRLRLSVTDTGVGLDDDEIEKALSPFGQVETSLSRNTSGAGLGLTLVTSLMKLHGGYLELVSQKGIGTTATLVFPKKRVVVDPARKAPVVPAEGEGTQDSTTRTIQ